MLNPNISIHSLRKFTAILFAVLIGAAILATGIMGSVTAHAAGGNGSHANENHTDKSDLLIIGDSRIEYLAAIDNSVSYNATVGAHWLFNKAWVTGTWKNKNMVISKKGYDYYDQQLKIVKASIKKNGHCTVVLESTINDVGFNNWKEDTLSAMQKTEKNFKKDIKDWDYFKKHDLKIKDVLDVYYTGIIPEKNQDSKVEAYNKKVKKAAEDHYIDLSCTTSTWKKYYASDKVHLTSDGSKKLLKMIKKAVS